MNYPKFDLEAAKAGAYVVTRDGRKARVACDLRGKDFPPVDLPYHLFVIDERGYAWTATSSGAGFQTGDAEYDIIGMWVEPKRMITVGSISYPAPEIEAPANGTKYYFVAGHGDACKGEWGDTSADNNRLQFGTIWLNRDDAEQAALARARINHGYVQSGADLPAQDTSPPPFRVVSHYGH